MKSILITLFFLISSCVFSQIDYNIYIGNTKKEILQQIKDDGNKPVIHEKLYVTIDSTGKWILDDNHYTYLINYDKIRGLFTFDNKTNRCVKYFLLCENLENYWEYFEYYNQILTKMNTEELTWIEKRHKYYVEIYLKALNGKQFKIFINTKPYSNEKVSK